MYLYSNGYIPTKTFGTYKKLNYVVVPLTKPYNTEGYDGYGDINTEYKWIVNRIDKKLKVMGDFRSN